MNLINRQAAPESFLSIHQMNSYDPMSKLSRTEAANWNKPAALPGINGFKRRRWTGKGVIYSMALPLLVMSTVLGEPSNEAVAAKKRVHTRSLGTGGGGVYLNTPEPQTPLEHNNRAVELGKRGLWSQAIKEHETALEGDPANPTFKMNLSGAYLRYGDQLAGQRKFYDAIHQYRMALYVDPNNNPADQGLDRCLKSGGKNPDDLRTRMSMADDADVSGNYPLAIVEYRKCCRMVDTGMMHYRLGRVLVKQGAQVGERLVEGYKELTTAIRKDWKPEERKELSDCHRQLGDILKEFALKARDSGAIDRGLRRLLNAGIEYRRAASINISDSDAKPQFNPDAIRGLVEVSREAVAIGPNSFDNHLTLAGAYQLAGDFDRAKKEYETCYKLKPGHPALAQARRSFHLAVVKSPLASPVMLAGTVQKIQDSLEQDPNDPELLYLYGRGKEAQGDRERAGRAYQAAAAINPLVNPDLKEGLQRLGLLAQDKPDQASRQTSGTSPAATTNTSQPANKPQLTAAVAKAGTLSNAPAIKSDRQASPLPNTQSTSLNPMSNPVTGSGSSTKTPTDKDTMVTQGNQPDSSTRTVDPASMSTASQGKSLTKNNEAIASVKAKLNSGDVDGAQKELLVLVDKEQTDGEAWKLLGQTHEKKGNLEEAQVCYRQSHDLKEPGAESLLRQISILRIEPLIREAERQEQSGNLVGAKSTLNEAVNIAPNISLPHQKLSLVLKKLGETKEADREVKRASELEKP